MHSKSHTKTTVHHTTKTHTVTKTTHHKTTVTKHHTAPAKTKKIEVAQTFNPDEPDDFLESAPKY